MEEYSKSDDSTRENKKKNRLNLKKSNNYYENNNNQDNKNKNDDYLPNNNSFTESDIDEFKNIFNQNDLKNNSLNNKSYDSSHLFEASEDNNYKTDEITLKDLDPKIKDVLILFVLSKDYYQLLIQVKAKKAFKFNLFN